MELKEFCQTLHRMGIFELSVYKQGECSDMLFKELDSQSKEKMEVLIIRDIDGIRNDFAVVYGIKFNLIKKDETTS